MGIRDVLSLPCRRVCVVACLLLSAAAAPAEPLAHLLSTTEPIFTRRDLDAIDRLTKLDDDQRTALTEVLLAAMTEGVRYNAESRAWYAEQGEATELLQLSGGARIKADAEIEAKYWGERRVKLIDIEKRGLDDVRSVLRDDQHAQAWSGYERFRRRELMCRTPYRPMTGDVLSLDALAEKADFTPDQRRALRPFEETLERRLDEYAPEYIRVRAAYADSVETYNQRMAKGEPYETVDGEHRKLRQQWFDASQKASVAFVQACVEAQRDMPADLKERFIRARADSMDLRGMLTNRYEPLSVESLTAEWPCAKELNPEQRKALAQLIDSTKAREYAVLARQIAAWDEQIVRDRSTQGLKRLPTIGKEITKLLADCDRDALSVLTPAQRDRVIGGVESEEDCRKVFMRRPGRDSDD